MALSTQRHDRDVAGLTYVYPVVSRRSRGLSIGINLNPNKACNFRCIYCQVPGLVAGKAPPIELDLLEAELEGFLLPVLQGDWMERNVPAGLRRLNDVAFSGDGEPTSAADFDAIVLRVGEVLRRHGLLGSVKVVLITNGSLATHDVVQRGLDALRELGGEVWFKVDAATDGGLARVNSWRGGVERLEQNLLATAARCATWIQTCVFGLDGEPPAEAELAAYLELLERVRDRSTPRPDGEGLDLRGVLLYGLARPSHQPEAPRLSRLPAEWLAALAARIEALGLECQVFP